MDTSDKQHLIRLVREEIAGGDVSLALDRLKDLLRCGTAQSEKRRTAVHCALYTPPS